MAAITLTSANNGESIEYSQGDEIILRLPENPTTGYRWHVDPLDGLAEQATAAPAVESAPPDPQFGRGGFREFRFRVTGSGTMRLALKRWREWEGESSVVERFAVELRRTG